MTCTIERRTILCTFKSPGINLKEKNNKIDGKRVIKAIKVKFPIKLHDFFFAVVIFIGSSGSLSS